MGVSIVAIIWEPFDAYNEAEKYNERLKREIFPEETPRLGLMLIPTQQGGQLGLCFRF